MTLALSFVSCALLWLCVALDTHGVLAAAFTTPAWECTLLSELYVPASTSSILVVYNLILAGT